MEQKKNGLRISGVQGMQSVWEKTSIFRKSENKTYCNRQKIWKAAFFQSLREAEIFAQKHLWYTGMDPQICYRAWVLVSIESEEEQEFVLEWKAVCPGTWEGKTFFPVRRKCRLM